MREIILAALLLAACSPTQQAKVDADLQKVQAIIAQVKAGTSVALADAQTALPYVCGAISVADGAFKLFDKNPSDLAWEATVVASIEPICAPGYQISDPTALMRTVINAWQQIAAQMAKT